MGAFIIALCGLRRHTKFGDVKFLNEVIEGDVLVDEIARRFVNITDMQVIIDWFQECYPGLVSIKIER
jgi:hypothetical protein